jgi:hypothetical protein
VGYSEHPGADSYFSTCLEDWFEELMVGRLNSIALGDAVQQLFQVFGVHFHGGGQFDNIYPYGKWGLRILERLCFGGLCLVCLVISSLVQMQGGQFSFY